MTLSIDLCVNMKKITSLTQIKSKLELLAEKYQANHSYSAHELEGIGHKIFKHYFIFTLNFEELKDDILKILIKDIKNIKNVSIDQIINI